MAPPHVALLPSRHHIAFIAALVRACNWPHSSLPACLLFGTPTSGQLPASGVFRKNVKHATVSSARFDDRAWASELRSRIGRIGARSSKKAAALSALFFFFLKCDDTSVYVLLNAVCLCVIMCVSFFPVSLDCESACIILIRAARHVPFKQ